MYALAPNILDALKIVKPETVLRWHRAGFRAYWRWKSRPRGGRPSTPAEIRVLIREMSIANPLWGAPRIHGELLKLGIDVGQTTVAKYMAKTTRPPSQGWKTFLVNHADGIASMDLFVVPTISFRLLYGFLILLHARRERLWLGVTAHPTAEWIAQQITEASGWRNAPRYVVRDRDRVYGARFVQRVRAMGIRDRPISPRSPWQNGYAERLIGSIRRDCLDHVVVFGEPHLRNLLRSYQRITMRGELICPYAKTRRSHAPSGPAAVSSSRPFWADCTININMGGFEFPTGTLIRTRTAVALDNVDVRLSPSCSDKNSKSHQSVWPEVFKPGR